MKSVFFNLQQSKNSKPMRTVKILDFSGATHRPATLDAPGGGSDFRGEVAEFSIRDKPREAWKYLTCQDRC